MFLTCAIFFLLHVVNIHYFDSYLFMSLQYYWAPFFIYTHIFVIKHTNMKFQLDPEII